MSGGIFVSRKGILDDGEENEYMGDVFFRHLIGLVD